MTRIVLTASAVAAAALALVAAAFGSSVFGAHASAVKLNGTVGPGYTITLTQHGERVKTLKAGTYKVVIADKATIHAFSLDGPHGFAKDFTTVPFVGTKSVTLTLKAGKYKYYCPPHESTMFGHFTVR
jgi:plastocyanin